MTPLPRPAQVLLNVAFAALCCALLARGGIIMAMAPKPGAVTERAAAVPPPPRPRPAAKVIPDVTPWGTVKEEAIVPGGVVAPDPLAAKPAGPLVPLANAQVVAITWWGDGNPNSMCSIVYNNEHTVHTVVDCEEDSRSPCNLVTEGYHVVRILADSIFILHVASGQEQELNLYEKKKKAVAEEVASAPEKPEEKAQPGQGSALSQLMDGVKQLGPNHYEAPAGMRENVLGRLNEVAMEGRWLPYFENGKIAGFKLAQTVPNSAFDKIGLKAGDVIKSVNGFDISSPDKMLDVFTKLKDSRDVNVDIVRNGNKKTSLSYTIN